MQVMKKLKLTNNEADSKPIHFHFLTDSRHLKLNHLMKGAFTASQSLHPAIKPITNNKAKKYGN